MVSSRKRSWCALGMLMGGLALSSPAATWQEDVGFVQLQTELGGSTPTGAGVGISQIEIPEAPDYYAPNPANTEFSNITFTLKSGTAGGYSGHATTEVGVFLYGSTSSIAPGITTVDAWNFNSWITTGFLNAGVSGSAPLVETRRIQNHSWVATYDNTTDQQIIRRFDYMINRDKVLALVGVNNDLSEPGGGNDRSLLSTSYHAIRVGCSDGGHMYGVTTTDNAGRDRVDIVVSAKSTSRATARASGAASLLYQTIINNASYAFANDPRVVKAILMSGATKETAMNWSNTSTAPLNAQYGAGQINIYNSYHILTAGRQTPSTSADTARQGWDTNTGTTTAKRYFFDVNDNFDIAVTLAWHRVIAPETVPNGKWNSPTHSLTDLNLRLYHASGYTLGTLVSESISTIEAHEHLWKTGLAPGRYALEVVSASGSADYGLAWRTKLAGAIGLSFADTLPGHLRTGLIPAFTVQAVTVAGLPDPSYQGSITVSSTGTSGTLTGTLTVQAVNGVATFNNVSVPSHGTLILNAAASGFTTVVRPTIQVARLVDVLIPQFIQGEYDGNGQDLNRLPFVYRVRLDGLKPSSTYRYGNRVVDAASILPDDPGQGNMLLARTSADPFVRCIQSPSFLASDLNLRHGTFTTDAQGSYEGWFFTEPANHVIFTPGQLVRLRILLNDGNGGESQAIALTSSSTVQTIQQGSGGGQATPVIGEALSAARNLVFLYTDEAGSTRPLAGTPVEVTGAATDTSYADYYHEVIAQTSRLWSTLVPNASFGSLHRIEERSLDNGSVMQFLTSTPGFEVPAADGTPAPLGDFTAYPRWAAAHFPSTLELADSQISGAGADPYDSGITNIQRYAGGLGSLDNPGPAIVRITQNSTSALVGFPFNPALTDLRTRVYGANALPTLDTLLFDSTTAINPQPDANGLLWLDFSRDGIPRHFFKLQLDLIP